MTVHANQLPVLSRLLDEVMELAPAQTEVWLNSLPAEFEHLRPGLRLILAEDALGQTDGFLAHGPKLDPDATAQVGDAIGPYRLIRQIGQGGMGAVWLAERTDGGLQRNIALKLPRLGWGAGLVERMRRERDIGALLEHPNIARLYEAGADTLGRPYLAIEYVDGQALDEWCSAHGSSLRDKLGLFLQVARAVAYAHGRLVIHRDIKPSNVLVDHDGLAHLLDFGIAKFLDDADHGRDLTREQGRVLSPRYASPEQIRQEAVTVTSDVYSLGVLLFELLSGHSPYAIEGKSVAALEAAILAGETQLASSKAEDKATAKLLRGELDSIIGKALKLEPGQRYATANAFAEDIERYLRGGRVLAQRDSARYRWGKTLRRHRVVFAAAGVVTTAVVGGAAASLVEAQRANAEATRVSIVRDFMFDLLGDSEPEEDSPGAEVTGRQMVAGAIARARLNFKDQPRLRGELLGELARMQEKLGETSTAAVVQEANALLERYAPPGDAALNRTRVQLARIDFDKGQIAEAESEARRALQACSSDQPDCAKVRGYASMLLADSDQRRGRPIEALAHARENIRFIETGFGKDSTETTMAWMGLALFARNGGQLEEAEDALATAERHSISQKLRASDRESLVRARAALDLDLGRFDSARSAFSRLAEQSRDGDSRAYNLRLLSQAWIELGFPEEAKRQSEAALLLIGSEDMTGEYVFARQAHARALSLMGQRSSTEISEVISGLLQLQYSPVSYEVLRARRYQAEILGRSNNLGLALKEVRALARDHETGKVEYPLERAQVYDLLGCLLHLDHNDTDAESAYFKAKSLYEHRIPNGHPLKARNELYLALLTSHPMAGRSDIERFLSLVEQYQGNFPPGSIRWRAAQESMGSDVFATHDRILFL